MAKRGGLKQHGTGKSKSDHGGLNKLKATPLKHSRAAQPSPHASKKGSGKPTSLHSTPGASAKQHPASLAPAPGKMQLRRRAEQRVNLAPSDEEGVSEESMSGGSGSDQPHALEEQNRQPQTSQKDEDRDAYARALRRMEMGPSDDDNEDEDEEEDGWGGSHSGRGGRSQGGTAGTSRGKRDRGDSSGQESSDGANEQDGVDSEDGVEEDGDEEDSDGGGGRLGQGQQQRRHTQEGGSKGAGDVSGLRGLGYYVGSSEEEEDEDEEVEGSSSMSSSDEEDGGEGADATGLAARRQLPQAVAGGAAAAGNALHGKRGRDEDGCKGNRSISSDEGGSEDVEDEDEQDEEAMFLAQLPLGERLALRTDGSGPEGPAARAAAAKARAAERTFKRANKHRPHEASSKKPVPRLREVIQPAHRPGKDPRFALAQTEAEKRAAVKRYSFVYDDMLPQDRLRIKAQLKQTRNERARAALTSQLQRVEQAMRAEQDRRRTEKIEAEWKAKERSALEGGAKAKPFYLKKGEKKKLALMARYQELKEKGQLDKYMEKRRKRNASKDHRHIPVAGRG